MASIRKRTNKDGSLSYRVEVRLKGAPPERATFKRLTDAKKWARNTESAIQEGRFFKSTESRKHTLSDAIIRYQESVLPGKKGEKKQKALLDWWKAEIGSHTLADTTPALIGECRDRLLEGITKRGTQRAPATVVRYLASLSNVFTAAVKEWGWLEDSPMRKVKKPKEPRGRVRYLSEDYIGPDENNIEGERTRLLKSCKASTNPFLYPVVVLALSTGMRQAEIMKLTWKDVDLSQGRITLHETKNEERRVVPLVSKALELLKEHSKIRRLDTQLLFPGKVKADRPMDLRSPWLKAKKTAQVDDFHFHDLRHSTASYLAMNGASLAEIAEVLGHKTLQMVKRYAHLSEAHTAGVVTRMNERIFGG